MAEDKKALVNENILQLQAGVPFAPEQVKEKFRHVLECTDSSEIAKIFNALSDPVRLELIEFLRDGEKCVCKITPQLKLIQPIVSRHLKILKDTSLSKEERRALGTCIR